MICPLLLAAFEVRGVHLEHETFLKESAGAYVACQERSCAWWHHDLERCAVSVLATELRELTTRFLLASTAPTNRDPGRIRVEQVP